MWSGSQEVGNRPQRQGQACGQRGGKGEIDPRDRKRRVVREEEKVKQTPAAGKGVWSEEREVGNRPQRQGQTCGQRGGKGETDPSSGKKRVVREEVKVKQTLGSGRDVWSERQEVGNRPQPEELACGQKSGNVQTEGSVNDGKAENEL